jgi:hypothetical protein
MLDCCLAGFDIDCIFIAMLEDGVCLVASRFKLLLGLAALLPVGDSISIHSGSGYTSMLRRSR